ncbi:MAG: phosphoribosylformylglycinamidine cyclo-ligase [Rhodospirillales bacterium]|nr:phosphoribosylformylglycinamidine cyclo-ligase [Rhodospirillales bacterium]
MSGFDYKAAGVDIDAGARLVDEIAPLAAATRRSGVVSGLGGFGALFDLRDTGYRDPVLVASTDGVGTKLKVAFAAGVHDSIGIDLVAMCVNDLVVQGAEPLFFLDYFATGRLRLDTARAVVGGIAAGCREAGCALIGGETAEMPGMYAHDDYDLAGFAVGAVERDRIVGSDPPRAGDVVLGLAASGLHANGFSLVRRIVAEKGYDYGDAAPFAADASLAQALLRPTRIYVRSCLAAIAGGGVRGLAHITGGGLIENIPRVLPDPLAVELEAKAWPLPPVMDWLKSAAHLPAAEMARTFNCGLGMICIAAADRADDVAAAFAQGGETLYTVGRVVRRDDGGPSVILRDVEQAWPR